MAGDTTNYRFLLMLKPEATCRKVDRPGLSQLVSDHLVCHRVQVLNRTELNGAMLRSEAALNYIYPRLTFIAREGAAALTANELSRLRSTASRSRILSSNQACVEFGISASAICIEGDRTEVVKLGPGAYAVHLRERRCVVLNHFLPEFQQRFYSDTATVVAMECEASGPHLPDKRDLLIGDIRPEHARVGSLRANLLLNAAHLGLGEVSVARNFLHMSPGYLEALYQLAFFFPEGGSFGDRLVRYGITFDIQKQKTFASDAVIAQIFARTECMSLQEIISGAGVWMTGLPR